LGYIGKFEVGVLEVKEVMSAYIAARFARLDLAAIVRDLRLFGSVRRDGYSYLGLLT